MNPPSRSRAVMSNLLSGSVISILLSIQAIVLVPLYLKYLGPKMYGAWLASGELLLWMVAFDFGIPSVLIQRIAAGHGSGDWASVGKYFGAGIAVLGTMSTVIPLVGFVLGMWIPGWLGLAGPEADTLRSCFRIGMFASAYIVFHNAFVAYGRGIQKIGLLNMGAAIASLCSLISALALLLCGWGLYALPLSMVARSVVLAGFDGIFLLRELRLGLGRYLGLGGQELRFLGNAMPVTAAGGLANYLVNNSEASIVGFVLGAEIVPILVITRKALDVGTMLMVSFTSAAYGAFTHLVHSDQRQRAVTIFRYIVNIASLCALAFAFTYVVLNRDIVRLWVGSQQFGGPLLTLLLAIRFVLGSLSYLLVSQYRACGNIKGSALIMVCAAALQVALMVVGMKHFGLIGGPVAGIVVALLVVSLVRPKIQAHLMGFGSWSGPGFFHEQFPRWVLLLSGGGLALVWTAPDWAWALLSGAFLFTVAVGLIFLLDPSRQGLLAFARGLLRARRRKDGEVQA